MEDIVLGFLIFAASYVTLMRVLARRDDVLHGEFIQSNGLSRFVPAAPSWLATLQRYLDVARQPARR